MLTVETRDLDKVYGDVVAVNGLTLSVKQGEVFGFLGPNGAGKTTTVKMLLGLVHPTGGEARLLERAPGDPEAMARVGFLPEHFRFQPWLKAADFLDTHGRLYGLTSQQRRERIPRLLARVGLSERTNARLSEFSKGMMQRIGLAQALLCQPDVVFLDEPTSGLDPLGRRHVRDLIRELRGQGVTVFLNSHLLSEVEMTCDRVAIIHKGKVVRQGTIAELTGPRLEVEVRATGLTPELVAQLGAWGEISWLDEGWIILRTEDEGVLPAVAEALLAGGARLYALAPRRLSLEELFVRVLETEAGQAEGWGEM